MCSNRGGDELLCRFRKNVFTHKFPESPDVQVFHRHLNAAYICESVNKCQGGHKYCNTFVPTGSNFKANISTSTSTKI